MPAASEFYLSHHGILAQARLRDFNHSAVSLQRFYIDFTILVDRIVVRGMDFVPTNPQQAGLTSRNGAEP